MIPLPFSGQPVLLVGLPLLLTAAAVTGWALLRRRGSNAAVTVSSLAALGCTAYSADTSWNFAADWLNMASTAERAGMFAAAELALFATALAARQNLASQGAPGLPGMMVWLLTGVQVIPAYAESGVVGGTVRAFVGPIMAATLWHLAMGIELRLRRPGSASRSLIATLARETRVRLLSRLGIDARDRDATQIARDRATARAVALVNRLAEQDPEQRTNWRGRRLTRRLSKAIAAVGTDRAQQGELLKQLAASRNAFVLVTMSLPSPWTTHPATESPTRHDASAFHTGTDHGDQHHPHTGTDHRDQHHPHTGTDHRDKVTHVAPLRRKPTPKSKARGHRDRPRSGRHAQRPAKEPTLSVEELAARVRPHVPELLERDGNESVTRVQLREILRREGLRGGRNDRLGLVLAHLRDQEKTPTKKRSASR
ncbi:hypothetical protein [Streptomyces albus]|uniref:hypothetical protein n=1 Tax=Streptomyces albus TaxID=1888 RepID=UPI003F195A02